MTWTNYAKSDAGITCVVDEKGAHDVIYELGSIETGRSRVFHRYYAKVVLADGSTVTGEDRYDLRAALFDLDRALRQKNMVLLASGLDDDWLESGLSQGTGWGYFPDATSATHIMALPPPRDRDAENDEFVDRLIKEAVDGMFIRQTASK